MKAIFNFFYFHVKFFDDPFFSFGYFMTFFVLLSYELRCIRIQIIKLCSLDIEKIEKMFYNLKNYLSKSINK